MKAMILAAGLGTRLRPYTLKRPKPLFPVLTKPLLHLTISRIKQAGFTAIVINSYHLPDLMEKAIQGEPGIVLQKEEKILGTGGGLRMALPHFEQDPVLVVNGDIYHSIDYSEVYRSHCAAKADVTLVLHDYPRFNDVVVDEIGRVTGFKRKGEKTTGQERILAFTGIHVINPEVLQAIPENTTSCIIDCYLKILQQGGSIRAYLPNDHFWTDMGTPADYLKLHADLLGRKVPVYRELVKTAAGAPFVAAENAAIGKNVKLLDWVCIGQGARIGAGASLERTVVWDGAFVPAQSIIKDAIVTS